MDTPKSQTDQDLTQNTVVDVHLHTSSDTRRPVRTEKAAAANKAARTKARRAKLLAAGGAVVGVVAVAATLVAVGLNKEPGESVETVKADDSLISSIASIPAATFDKVGVGAAQAAPTKIDAPALTEDGKPRVLYVGAEYCPFCAAERWPVTVALSRFGTFTDLNKTASAADDVYPNTPTLSYHGSTYTSDYLAFEGVELTTNERVNGSYEPLDKLSAEDQKLFTTYNAEPYVASGGGIPFVDAGGTYVTAGASFDPELLKGKTQEQIAKALADPDTELAKAIDGSANLWTAALCDLTGGQPANVCTAPGVKIAATKLATR